MSRPLNIGQAAAAAGLTAKMIRHYEQVGLLPAAARTDAGYRQYGERELAVLRFIRQSRQLGFSIEQTAGLLGLWADTGRSSREVKALAQAHNRSVYGIQNKLEAIGLTSHAERSRNFGDQRWPTGSIGLAAPPPIAVTSGSVATPIGRTRGRDGVTKAGGDVGSASTRSPEGLSQADREDQARQSPPTLPVRAALASDPGHEVQAAAPVPAAPERLVVRPRPSWEPPPR